MSVSGMRLYQIEFAVERKVIADIRQRQKRIPGLRQDEFKYTAFWGDGDLSAGCRECLKGTWTQVRTSSRCNLDCVFCYYHGRGQHYPGGPMPRQLYHIGGQARFFSKEDVMQVFKAQGKGRIKGVAWLFYEPLMDLEKILPVMSFLQREGYRQWLYTNGLLAGEDTLKELSDRGLDEIRFNLAATNCSLNVIKNMRAARRYFKFLCVESPVFSGFYHSFIKERRRILDTGVDHIHLAELQLFPQTLKHFKAEGPIYRYKQGYVSPIKSRQLTYDIFEAAVREKWKNVVLHDCSNETKFYRGIYSGRGAVFGDIAYYPDAGMELPKSFYADALKRYDPQALLKQE